LIKQNTITVFEHQILRTDSGVTRITKEQLKTLQSYYGNGVPYYSLIHNGVQFNEHVGVLQIGKTLIEVLPKADKYSNDTETWRNILIGMLRTVSGFEINNTGNAKLRSKPNSILDLYFGLFITEVEYLLNIGLIKRYRKIEGNIPSLRGNLIFSKNILFNIAHQERFYTRHTTYDNKHILHEIIYKALILINKINGSSFLQGRLGALLLNFPEMKDINVDESTFNKIEYDRKSFAYKKAIEIAKIIILKYHPDITRGSNDMIALMFDMNKLWEKFVYISVRKNIPKNYKITAQTTKNFWAPTSGRSSYLQPDIIITNDNQKNIVLDTKWKNITGKNPSPEDLRQMYVYHNYFNADKVALVYPGDDTIRKGLYFDPNETLSNVMCSVLTIDTNKDINQWQKQIYNRILNWSNEI
jgi:5-methylcytosine-specific restriction enzyme subunit McrC